MSNTKKSVDTEKMIKENVSKKTKVKFNDRVEIEITSTDMRHFKKGDKVRVHKIVADQYVSDKLATLTKK